MISGIAKGRGEILLPYFACYGQTNVLDEILEDFFKAVWIGEESGTHTALDRELFGTTAIDVDTCHILFPIQPPNDPSEPPSPIPFCIDLTQLAQPAGQDQDRPCRAGR